MATYNNETKASTAFTNEPLAETGLTWGEANFSWEDATGTWQRPFSYVNETKASTSFTNGTKN